MIRRPRPEHASTSAVGLVVALGVLLAGCAGSAPGDDGPDRAASSPSTSTSPRASAVECGTSTYDDGHQVVRYCGDGTATATVGSGGPVDVPGTTCDRHGAFVTINAGTNFSNPDAAQGDYLGVLMSAPAKTGQKPAESTDASGVELVLDGERVAISEPSITALGDHDALEVTVTGRSDDGEVTLRLSCRME